MKNKPALYLCVLLLLQINLFSQSEQLNSEFYVQLGTNNGYRYYVPNYEFQMHPILFIGYGTYRFSAQIGISHSIYSHYYPDIRCVTYPCPDAIDFKSVELFFDLKYKILEKERLTLEPAFSLNSEVIYHQLRYYKNNKDESWASENTPYRTRPNVHAGFNVDYAITNRFSFFIMPMFNLILRPSLLRSVAKDEFKFRTGLQIKLKK